MTIENTDWKRRLRISRAVWRKRGARDSSLRDELAAALWQLRRERRWATRALSSGVGADSARDSRAALASGAVGDSVTRTIWERLEDESDA